MALRVVARTGGSKRVQAQPAGSKWVQALPAGSKWVQAQPAGSKRMQALPAGQTSVGVWGSAKRQRSLPQPARVGNADRKSAGKPADS